MSLALLWCVHFLYVFFFLSFCRSDSIDYSVSLLQFGFVFQLFKSTRVKLAWVNLEMGNKDGL